MLFGAAGAVALAAVVAVVAIFAVGSDPAAAEVLRDAGCTVTTHADQGARHVEAKPEGFTYNSFPPTTGPHNAVPAELAIYDEPVDQLRLLHDMEHGAVVVQYGEDVPRTAVDAITQWYRENPDGLVVAPLPALGDMIALGAWTAPEAAPGEEVSGQGVLAKCSAFDEEAFDAFVSEYGFKGPERFTREQLRQGTFGGQGG